MVSSYAALRRRLLIDPHIPKDGSNFPDPVMDNPLSQDPGKYYCIIIFHVYKLRKLVKCDHKLLDFGYWADWLLIPARCVNVDTDSMWGRFFQKAELEKMVDQDLSRLYPEHGSYFQTPGCQGMLRRILLLWCIRHPNYGYRQGNILCIYFKINSLIFG